MRSGRIALGSLLALAWGLGVAFGKQQQDITVKTQAVAGKVAVLFGDGGNIGASSGPDGILIVDDQFERLSGKIEAELAKLSPERSAPRFLVNTHHHGDHTDGNKHFGKSAVVVAHENVRKRLEGDKAPAQSLPIVTFADRLALHFNGEEIRVIHVPDGHTDGDAVVWFTGSKVIHLGDLYFQLGYPFIDTASGGNVQGMFEGLRGLLEQLPADVRVIPGHGEVTGRKELEEYVKMLETITERVRAGLEQGKDAAAMVAAGVTKEFDARWGHFDFVTPERFVQSVIASLR